MTTQQLMVDFGKCCFAVRQLNPTERTGDAPTAVLLLGIQLPQGTVRPSKVGRTQENVTTNSVCARACATQLVKWITFTECENRGRTSSASTASWELWRRCHQCCCGLPKTVEKVIGGSLGHWNTDRLVRHSRVCDSIDIRCVQKHICICTIICYMQKHVHHTRLCSHTAMYGVPACFWCFSKVSSCSWRTGC